MRARTEDIPSSAIPTPHSAAIEPDVQHQQTLVPMLQSLFRGQLIIMHSLRELAQNRQILEVVPLSPPLIIISDASSYEATAPPDTPAEETADPPASPVGEIANLSDSSSGEVVALTDSLV
ncbi:hypothetical protein JHK87_039566 [Glycine soja]|nr:hypothetical protein JHK87_039566 [Glycine soja]